MMFDKNTIVSALIAGKKSIFNLRIKNGNRKFQLAGVGAKSLKVRPTRLPDYPHLELVGFLSWNEWDEFTPQEKKLVEAFYSQIK